VLRRNLLSRVTGKSGDDGGLAGIRARYRSVLIEFACFLVSKLETPMEVLLHSESSSGSTTRVLEAIRAFYGLEPDQFINSHSQTTVKQFAAGFVRDRSRISTGPGRPWSIRCGRAVGVWRFSSRIYWRVTYSSCRRMRRLLA